MGSDGPLRLAPSGASAGTGSSSELPCGGGADLPDAYNRGVRCVGLLLLLAGAARGGDELPLPTRKSTILRVQGTTYFVEGRRRIPWGVEISIQKETRIVGRGAGAVLEVAGELEVHGVRGGEVILKDLWVEPAPKFGKIQLDTVKFRSRGGVRTPEGQTVDGDLVIENTDFVEDTSVDVSFSGGLIRFLSAGFKKPVHLHGRPAAGKTKGTVKLSAIGCFAPSIYFGRLHGFEAGLVVSGIRKATIRNCRVGGAKSEFVDCSALTFDGNRVDSALLAFRNTKPGLFRGTKLQKCDVYAKEVVFFGPRDKKREVVLLDKCWFRGHTRVKDIQADVIKDAGDDERCGVTTHFVKLKQRPHRLADTAPPR